MLKVLHVINGANLGGISSMLLNYYRHMDRDKIHFDFAYSVEPLGPHGMELQQLGASFFYVPKKSADYRAHTRAIRELLKKGNYDAIHVHSSLTSWVDLRVAAKCGIKTRFCHAHNANKAPQGFKARLRRFVGVRLMRRYATLRVSCGKDAAIYTFGRRSLEEQSMRILPNAIETARFAFDEEARLAVREALGIERDAFVLGTVGRMSSEKNQIRLVRIMPAVLARMPDSRLLLVGDGDCRAAIEAEAAQLGVSERVIFTGGREDVAQMLSAMDVFLLPSFQEGFGIAVLEAAASGLPVIVSDVVTQALAFIPHIQYLSLQEQDDAWAKAVCDCRAVARNTDGVEVVASHGYDIAAVAQQLEEYYQNPETPHELD